MKLRGALALMLISTVGFCQQTYYDVTAGTGNGLRFWQSDGYKIHMGIGAEYQYGPVTDYSLKSNMDLSAPNRGWTWGVSGQTPIGALNTTGSMQIAGSFTSSSLRTGPMLNGTNSDFESLAVYNTTASNLASGNGAVIQFYNNTNNQNGLKGSSIKSVSSDGYFGWESDLYFRTTRNNSYSTQTILDAMVIKGGSGYVGIGTTNPGSKLAVYGAASAEESITNVTNGVDQDFLVRVSGVGAGVKRTIIGPSVSTRLSLGVGVNSNNEHLTIINGGNVGIGTTQPDQKLTVNGTIHATRVKVETTVPAPDYVFEESYSLPTLDDVKSYIDENKHLPEVPSAKEMEAKGIDVEEMNMLLLKKVEELTLYILQQEQRIKALEEKDNH